MDTEEKDELEELMSSDEKIADNRKEAREAEQFAEWANSPMGRKVLEPVKKDIRNLLKSLFEQATENPTLGQLLSTIAQLDAKLKVVKQFSGAKNNAILLQSILEENEREFKSRYTS